MKGWAAGNREQSDRCPLNTPEHPQVSDKLWHWNGITSCKKQSFKLWAISFNLNTAPFLVRPCSVCSTKWCTVKLRSDTNWRKEPEPFRWNNDWSVFRSTSSIRVTAGDGLTQHQSLSSRATLARAAANTHATGEDTNTWSNISSSTLVFSRNVLLCRPTFPFSISELMCGPSVAESSFTVRRISI